MTEAAVAARPSRVLAALGRAADGVARHVVVALATILAFQVLATVALFFSVNRNGWLTYQGGDQIWLVASAWLLGKGTIGYALTSPGWPMLLAPLTWITGSAGSSCSRDDDRPVGVLADPDAHGLRHRCALRGRIAAPSIRPDAAVHLDARLQQQRHSWSELVPQLAPAKRSRRAPHFPHCRQRFPSRSTAGVPMPASSTSARATRTRRADIAAFAAAQAQVEALIAREATHGVRRAHRAHQLLPRAAPSRCTPGLRRPEPLAAIVALSFYLIAPDALAADEPGDRDIPIFMARARRTPSCSSAGPRRHTTRSSPPASRSSALRARCRTSATPARSSR